MRRRFRSLLRSRGLDVVRYPYGQGSLRDGLARIAPHFQPATLVDVGVGHGTPELYEAWPQASLLLVEPVAEMETHLQRILASRHGSYALVAAGSRAGRRVMHISRVSPHHSGFYDYEEIADWDWLDRNVPTATLDQLAAESGLAGPYVIKLDVQGDEIEVLRGATNIMRQSCCVVCEATVVPHRGFNGPLAGDLIAYMNDQDFSIFDIVSGHRHGTNDLCQIDVAFAPSAFVSARREHR